MKRLILLALLQLLFLGGLLEKAHSLSASFPKRDEVITAQLEAMLAKDPLFSRFNLDLSTRAAVVSVRGAVNTRAEAKKLLILVNSLAGVQGVDASRILIKKPRLASLSMNDIISSLILGLYIREGLIHADHPEKAALRVRVEGGIVYLSGSVDTEASAAQAVSLAQTIPGVVKVESTLTTW